MPNLKFKSFMDSIVGACVLNVLQRAARNSVDLLSLRLLLFIAMKAVISISFEIIKCRQYKMNEPVRKEKCAP